MPDNVPHSPVDDEVLNVNVAAVGGGKACKFFLDFVHKRFFPCLSLNIVAVCDVNPGAEGMELARELGIHTATDFRDILALEGLDGVIELTGRKDVLLDLIRLRPKGVWILDHNLGVLVKTLSMLDEKLRKNEQEAALEKMVSEFLLQHSNERIVLLSPDFIVLDVNEGYLKSVNRTRAEVVGAHCYEITHGYGSPCSEWESELKCPMVETLSTGRSAHAIHKHGTEGAFSFCDMETFPVKDARNRVLRVIEVWRDITEELTVQWETRIRDLKTNLGKLAQEDRMLSLGKLSASCVHEINNPIQGLLTFAHLMKRGLDKGRPSDEELKEFSGYLSLMCSELERCGTIVSGLLSFARQSRMETREVDLNDIVSAVTALTRHTLELNNISLELALSATPLTIRGDVNQLQQCFLNLIFNAVDAMPEGGGFFVGSALNTERDQAKIVVRDSGCGIAEELLPNIFDPFFTSKKEGMGTGLGLSIVYGVVKGHDGSIEVDTRPGEGTTFTLTFPVVEKGESGTEERYG